MSRRNNVSSDEYRYSSSRNGRNEESGNLSENCKGCIYFNDINYSCTYRDVNVRKDLKRNCVK